MLDSWATIKNRVCLKTGCPKFNYASCFIVPPMLDKHCSGSTIKSRAIPNLWFMKLTHYAQHRPRDWPTGPTTFLLCTSGSLTPPTSPFVATGTPLVAADWYPVLRCGAGKIWDAPPAQPEWSGQRWLLGVPVNAWKPLQKTEKTVLKVVKSGP